MELSRFFVFFTHLQPAILRAKLPKESPQTWMDCALKHRIKPMSLRIEPNAEPIPGYRLIERIGSGGFGEGWKAEAPGGLFKAIKFVQREGHSEDSVALGGGESDRSRADQEWKSLVRVKSVRH